MALHKCLQQAVKERLIVTNPCDAVTLPSGEKPEIAALTNEQQRALVQISYRHRYGVFVRLDLSTGLRMGELLALRWEDIDLVGAQLTVKRTINRLARYEQDEGKHSTEIVFDTPKTQNACRTIPLTRSVIEDLKRWRSIQLADQNAAGAAYQDTGFVVTNELGMYFEQRTFKDYYNLDAAGCRYRSLYVPCVASYLCNQSPGKGNGLQNPVRHPGALLRIIHDGYLCAQHG